MMTRLIAAMMVMTSGPAFSATIDFTSYVGQINVGAPVQIIDGVRVETMTGGYLQATHLGGVGVCSAVGWSCNEIEFPEALRLTFAGPVTLTEVVWGYLQPQSPWADGPGYLPAAELAAVRPDVGHPVFGAGVDMTTGVYAMPLDLTITSWAEFFGIGRQSVGVFPVLMAASVRSVSWKPFLPPIVVDPQPPMGPNPPATPDPPVVPPGVPDVPPSDPPSVPVPEPSLLALVGLGLLVGLRRARRV